MKIKNVRTVLLSAPYADPSNAEVKLHLPSGYRTCGMVEITLENGIKGLGEGYLAVFAPKVFLEITKLLKPVLTGRNLIDRDKILSDLTIATGYWSLQGAARHVLSAIDIALLDCEARFMGIPVFKLLGSNNRSLQIYGSGGDSVSRDAMEKELKYIDQLGISIFKIRARKENMDKAIWTINMAGEIGMKVAIDMTQNLVSPGQKTEDVLEFEKFIHEHTGELPFFLEESLGMNYINEYPRLKKEVKSKLAGGEIVTTETELIDRIKHGYYHIVQPDATVIGGISPVMKIFKAAAKNKLEVVPHCWGGPVGMMANYHAAIAGGADFAEWPMPAFPLRDEMVQHPWNIQKGFLHLSGSPGLGVKLTEAIEKKYKFKEEAVYHCLSKNSLATYNDD